MQQAGHAERYFRDITRGHYFNLSQAHCADKSLILCSGRSKARPRWPGASDVARVKVPDLREHTSKIINFVVYLLGRACRQGIRWVPLRWRGADVLLDPGDEHDGIVLFGTDGDA